MIDLIWLMKRIKHLIKTFKYVTIIYIDYVVNSFITRQIKFISNNVDKLNIKLIRASIYLSQFRFDVRYKFDKSHIIFDALSRLSTNNCMFSDKNDVFDIENFHDDIIDSNNDVTYIYNNDLITISEKFKLKLQKNYRIDKTWIKILIMLEFLNARLIKKQENISQQIDVLQKSFINQLRESIAFNSFKRTQILLSQSTDDITQSIVEILSSKSNIDRQNNNNRRTHIDFQLIDELIYHIHKNNDYEFEQSKLCIFETC